MNCCDVNGLNRMFRGNFVRADRRRFLQRGLDTRQRALLDFPLAGASHLDLGCGVGALGLTGLRDGLAAAFFVDVSTAYLEVARELAEAFGVAARATFLQGDATRLELPEADLVTLDRVVCCYPDARQLLAVAARASRGRLSFSYPPDRWWTRAPRALLNGALRLLRRDYRAFVHPERELHAAAASAGHTLTRTQRFGLWRVAVFDRAPGAA